MVYLLLYGVYIILGFTFVLGTIWKAKSFSLQPSYKSAGLHYNQVKVDYVSILGPLLSKKLWDYLTWFMSIRVLF